MAEHKLTFKRLHFLDSLRGLAALIVVFHHFMVFNTSYLQAKFSPFVMNIFYFISDLNVVAVLFFFILSGFSIGLAQKGKLIESRLEANEYFYKRFKRILPIYWIALGLAGLVGIFVHALEANTYHFYNLLGNLLFLQTSPLTGNYWFSPYGNNGPLWSLSYEMFFYLFFPLFSACLFKKPFIQQKWILWPILFFITLSAILINKYLFFIPYAAFLSFFIVWWAGFKIAQAYIKQKKEWMFWGIIFIGALTLVIFKNRIPSASIIEIAKALLIAVFFYSLLLLNGYWHSKFKNMIKKAFNKAFNAVGHGSYALYALHYPFFIYMNHTKLDLVYQIILIFALIICCIFLEKNINNKKFRIFALNYMFIKRNKIG